MCGSSLCVRPKQPVVWRGGADVLRDVWGGLYSGGVAPSADGYPDQPFSMTGDYGTGVSGPLNVFVSGLVGVFTTGAAPSGPAPAPLDSG